MKKWETCTDPVRVEKRTRGPTREKAMGIAFVRIRTPERTKSEHTSVRARGGAQTKLFDGKVLVEGETPTRGAESWCAEKAMTKNSPKGGFFCKI